MEDLTSMRRYELKKPYVSGEGTLQEGGEITFFRGMVYYNGGLCDLVSGEKLRSLINDPEIYKEYFKEVPIIYNKV